MLTLSFTLSEIAVCQKENKTESFKIDSNALNEFLVLKKQTNLLQCVLLYCWHLTLKINDITDTFSVIINFHLNKAVVSDRR